MSVGAANSGAQVRELKMPKSILKSRASAFGFAIIMALTSLIAR